ncbi:conserved hypothetical protein [Candidatus Accumulibacter aalborgensis]|uniref:Membrane protein of uknown function UCP014873 n=1 Tax=Candidatus Accumulibacter aalborgensis TaxID=1860102 RepID=A0A1A8XN67_9PROT|nr:DUF1269 domain-containing protein [Candidatus Accumulibacter aalborgensis]SBT05867.1 conserved hypothetical protein [Candidatus Accumulibacter aalborgensis]
MATLVVIGYDTETQAEETKLKLAQLQKEYLIELEDAVIAIKKPNGKVKLIQPVNLTATGAASGSFWGLLIGMIFMMPIVGVAIGAATGAIGGALTDLGINDNFMKNIAENLKPGGSQLFILFKSWTEDKALIELQGMGGTIIQTSLSHEDTEKLQAALDAAKADEPVQTAQTADAAS